MALFNTAKDGQNTTVLAIGCESFTVRPGGLNRYFESLSEHINGRVQLLSVLPGNYLRNTTLPGWTRTALRMGVAPIYYLRNRARVDIVDSHFALYTLLLLPILAVARRDLIVHFHGPWAEESTIARGGKIGIRGHLKLAIEKSVYKRASAVVVLSYAFKELLADVYGVADDVILVVRPGIDLERFKVEETKSVEQRRGEVDELIYAGKYAFAARRLDPRMGLDVLIAAWQKGEKRFDGARLLIAGDGRERQYLEELAKRSRDRSRIQFLGRVSDGDLVKLYRNAAFTVVPSLALEGFGLVALESLATGTPPIVSAIEGLPEVVNPLDPSLAFPAGDVDALLTRMVKAFEGNLPTAQECRRYAETFSWDTAAEVHLDIYRSTISKAHV